MLKKIVMNSYTLVRLLLAGLVPLFSTSLYAQRVKIECAKRALETSRKTINEVMYDVGYADIKAFREVFRKITGMSPLEYRNRYNKEAAA